LSPSRYGLLAAIFSVTVVEESSETNINEETHKLASAKLIGVAA